jgi:predicted phage terminase large subunit-like protein
MHADDFQPRLRLQDREGKRLQRHRGHQRGETGFHLRLVSRGRWEFPELKRQAVALADIWRPHAVLIEDAASGQSLIQALKSETRLPILPVKPQGDKVSRAHAVSPLVESGRVVLPTEAAWLSDFLEEVISFPSAPHDDQVDALTQALSYLRGSFFDSADWQRTGAMQLAYHAERRRGARPSGR